MPKQRNRGRVKETGGAKRWTATNARRRGDTRNGPMPKDWAWLDAISGPFDADMIEAALEQPVQQDRPDLEKLFPSGGK